MVDKVDGPGLQSPGLCGIMDVGGIAIMGWVYHQERHDDRTGHFAPVHVTPRSEQLHLRLERRQARTLRRAAMRDRMSISAYVWRAALHYWRATEPARGGEELPPYPGPPDGPEEPPARGEAEL